MAKATLDQLRSLPDFAEVTRWDLTFATTPIAASGDFPVSEDINLRCESSTVPKATNEKIEVRHRGLRVFQNGITLPEGQLTLTFNETVDAKIRKLIKSWRDAVYNFTSGKGGKKADIIATIILDELDKEDKAVWRYTLKGCFIEDYELGDRSAEGSEIIKPSITISYDDFEDGAA